MVIEVNAKLGGNITLKIPKMPGGVQRRIHRKNNIQTETFQSMKCCTDWKG